MKPFSIAAALYLASFAAAAPVAFEERAAVELEDRQLFGSGRRDDLINNVPCRRITYIFARGTTETPNLVWPLFGSNFLSDQATNKPRL